MKFAGKTGLTTEKIVKLREKAKNGTEDIKVHIHSFKPGELSKGPSWGIYAGPSNKSITEMAWIDTIFNFDTIKRKYPTALVMS